MTGHSGNDMYGVPQGQYKPLSPWAYWGLSILYAVPVIGLVFFIIHIFSSANINRRNFARSYLIGVVAAIIIAAVLYFQFGVSLGEAAALIDQLG